MSCESRLDDIALYIYGELAPEDEERLEAHADGCADCTREITRVRAVGRALDRRSLDPSAALLAECRQELMVAVHSQPAAGALFAGLRGAFSGWFEPAAGLRRLAAAGALVAAGFLAARLSMKAVPNQPGATNPPVEPPAQTAGFAVSGIHTVTDPSGEDRIVLDGTRSDQVSGPASDEQILKYLLTAATDAANPGVRVESLEILKNQPSSEEVRRALVHVLVRDPNPGVRLMALQGLKQAAAEVEVHHALTRALMVDDNPGVRIQVIQILTERKDHELVPFLQDLVQKEDNNYVKIQCQKALRDMKASEGHF
jgi:anti-sigma factor RsiW